MGRSQRDVFHRHFHKNQFVCTASTTAASQQTAELISGTKVEHFPNIEKKQKNKLDLTRTHHTKAEDVLRRLFHTMKCSYYSCPMK